ncbi:dTDP-4-dehydrorhamnose reductase [Micromonospora sp. B11E3]|uniref:dTDP-4-dehydrorhamnose reductase n=1 Tax=Micromonospora sp. B11E3 TaxID=3153562 RepID=UPI00325D25FB
MSRWLITGAGGLLGRELTHRLNHHGHEAYGLDREHLDIRDRVAVAAAVSAVAPDVVVNCAAVTSIERCEADQELAMAVNAAGVRNLAEICAGTGSRLVHISTDYVFGGRASLPYPEDAPPDPGNAYGRTKVVGERAVREALPDTGYVLRTSWLYGTTGRSFVRTMIRLEREQESTAVVDDQRGQPTWAGDVTERILDMLRLGVPAGIYHATNSGSATWYELAREVFALLGADPARIRSTTSAERGETVARPAFSVLGHGRWRAVGLPPLRHWRTALHAAFPQVLRAADATEAATGGARDRTHVQPKE